MIDLTRGLRHMAWANDRFYAQLAVLPSDALQARYAPDAWSVGRLAVHIINGAEWYRYCLTGVEWTDLSPLVGDVPAMRSYLAELDALLLAEADKPEGHVTFEDEDGPARALRSTLLTQAVIHAAEHRAHMATALEVAGAGRIDLDALDLWAFEAWERGVGGNAGA